MVQIHHGTIVPWYNAPWYTMVLFHKGNLDGEDNSMENGNNFAVLSM